MNLEEESERATSLLEGKVVKRIVRFRDQEVMIEFEDGARFFADCDSKIELSITPSE